MKLIIFISAIVIADVAIGLPTFGKIQSAGVKGRLLCGGKPYFNAKVKLWDVDTLDLDDLMAEGVSDHDGNFHLSGNETELTSIDPKLNIYHNCDDEQVECLRKIQIIIPKDFVSEGAEPAKIFDAGVLNLSGKFPGEGRDCIN